MQCLTWGCPDSARVLGLPSSSLLDGCTASSVQCQVQDVDVSGDCSTDCQVSWRYFSQQATVPLKFCAGYNLVKTVCEGLFGRPVRLSVYRNALRLNQRTCTSLHELAEACLLRFISLHLIHNVG